MNEEELIQENLVKPPPLPPFQRFAKIVSWIKADRLFVWICLLITALQLSSLLGIVFLPLEQSYALYDRVLTGAWLYSIFINWLIMGTIAKKTRDLGKRRFRFFFVFLNMALFIPNFFLGMPRIDCREKLEWECNGIITEHYVSTNHQALAIEISGTPPIKFEGVNVSFYEIAKVGDVIAKKPWDEYAELNGVRHKIVDQWEGWPFGM